MLVRFVLLLRGIDLRDADARAAIPEELDDLDFEACEEISSVVIYCEDHLAPIEAVRVARRIERYLPGVEVVEVHDELVALGDIAVRTGMKHEAVRLWAAGKRRAGGTPFPGPRQIVAAERGRSMKLYAWREVVSWIRQIIKVDPEHGVCFLSDVQIHEINACLSKVTSPSQSVLVGGRVSIKTQPSSSYSAASAQFLLLSGGLEDVTSPTRRTRPKLANAL
ncbi:hypothetical protein [Nocardioides sp. LS1]|uniref:hypothetical protein n=1 Tax=Nocardioides sp. LS1 TaxID=1027620 RepID=UPI000F622BDD|nr:hypothetical protein [Nocardioides sp. LS1]GCD91206.1 hypothetical protein NLS1_32120 [Nocardioides sp. LS1]